MTTPIYREIAERLRQQIESGEFESGAQLPTEQDLQAQHNASRNTIREAIRQLITLGVVETRPGQGTFVVPKVEPFVTTLTGNPETTVDYISGVLGKAGKATASGMQVEIQEASGDAAYLGLEPGNEVISRHRRRFIDDVPWALETSFYPGEFADRGADKLRKPCNVDEGTPTYLRNSIKVRQVGCRDWDTKSRNKADSSICLPIMLYRTEVTESYVTIERHQGTRIRRGIARSGTRWKLSRSGARCGLARSGRKRWRHDKPASSAPFKQQPQPVVKPLRCAALDEHEEQRRSREVIQAGDRAPSVRHNDIESSRIRV